MVVRSLTDHPCHKKLIGRTLITLTTLVDGNVWRFEEGSVPCPNSGACEPGAQCRFDGFSDSVLQPFDALKDADDESVAEGSIGQSA